MMKMSGDTPSTYTTSSPQAIFTNPPHEGGNAQHLDRLCPSPYNTNQSNILQSRSRSCQNWHSQSLPSLTRHIDVRMCNNSRSIDDIVIRSRVKSKPLPRTSCSPHHQLQRHLSHKMPIHSAPTSLSLRRPPRLSGDDQFSEEHAIMSPDPSTACNSAMGSSSIASILGPVEMLTRILIPNSKIGAVIGKGGSIIKKIRESSGAKITICGSCAGAPGSGGGANAADDSGDRMVTIVGLYLTVLAAFSAIVRQTEPVFGKRGTDEPTWGGGGHNSGSTCVRLLVPNNKAGGLIGRGGSTIRVIRDQSCARIEISTQGLAVAGGGLLDRIVTITGTYSAYIRAFKMICLQLADIPNSGILATSPTSQNDVVPGNGGTVRGGGVVNNTPTSQIHQQSQPGQQQQNLGYGIGMFRGNLALQFSPASQSGSPFHIPPGPSCRTQQSEQPKLLSSSGYAPPAAWANIAPDQGRVRRTSITTPTNSVGCLPHSLNGGRRRSSSTPDNYYSSSSPSFIADFTADVIRNIGLKYDEKMFNSSTTSSVPARCATSPTPIKITVDMDIPYEALTALRLDHGFSNIMNISGAVLEELQTPVSTSNGLHSSVGEVCVKGDDGIKRVEELGVEEFNKQECDSGKKDKCKEEGGQSDLLEHQEGTLPLEWVNDYSSGSISSSNISSVTSISTKSLGDSESSLDGVKDNAAFNGGCISSSNRISITGTLEEIELAQLLVTSRLTQKKDDIDFSLTCDSAPFSSLPN